MARKHGFFRPHVAGLSGIYSTTLREGGGDIIRSIFADGTDGFYFDFSKTDRLFQTVTGVTPADDAGENIGLAMESHSTLWGTKTLAELVAAQPELVTNGDFSSGVGWTVAAGWTVSGGELVGVATGGAYKQTILTANRVYRRSLDMVSVSAGNVRFDLQGSVGPVLTTPGGYASYGMATGGDIAIQGTTFTGSVDNASIKLIPGNHGLQATTSAQPKWQTGGLARFDGSDDNLLTTLVPGTAMTLIVKMNATNVAANRVAIGCQAANGTNIDIGIGSTGKLRGAAGNAAILSSADIGSATMVGALTLSGTGIKLYLNGAEVNSGTISGAVNTTVALTLGAYNNNGTAIAFLPGDIYHALAIKKALTAAEIAAITNLWGTT